MFISARCCCIMSHSITNHLSFFINLQVTWLVLLDYRMNLTSLAWACFVCLWLVSWQVAGDSGQLSSTCLSHLSSSLAQACSHSSGRGPERNQMFLKPLLELLCYCYKIVQHKSHSQAQSTNEKYNQRAQTQGDIQNN